VGALERFLVDEMVRCAWWRQHRFVQAEKYGLMPEAQKPKTNNSGINFGLMREVIAEHEAEQARRANLARQAGLEYDPRRRG
jgi:hypothetical protein